jgi:hypothetical protein
VPGAERRHALIVEGISFGAVISLERANRPRARVHEARMTMHTAEIGGLEVVKPRRLGILGSATIRGVFLGFAQRSTTRQRVRAARTEVARPA